MRRLKAAVAAMLMLAGMVLVPVSASETAVRALLQSQQEAWNRGDIPGFMAGYWADPQLRFASGGDITWGHVETLARYQARYRNKDEMGQLRFDVLEVKLLSDSAALVFGRWALQRKTDAPHGLFTLLVEKRPEGWRVTRDHTSSGD